MQNLLFEVSHETQVFVENECTTKGHTMKDFFEILIETYKNKDKQVSKKKDDFASIESKSETEVTTITEAEETPIKKKSKSKKD